MLGKVSKVIFFERFGLMQSWHQTNSAARFKRKTGARFCLTFNTEESEGYRLIDVKNLSTTVSKAHMCEKGENFLL